MGLFGLTDEGTHTLLFGMSLSALLIALSIVLYLSLQGYTVDLTSSRPLVYPLRDSLARPQALVLNKSYDLPNPYRYWTNDLQRSLPHGSMGRL